MEKRGVVIVSLVFAVFLISFVSQSYIDALLNGTVGWRSEYAVGEQLTKFLLFISIIISAWVYQHSSDTDIVILSVSVMLFSLAIYMAESNMINEKSQPLFGIIGASACGLSLLKLRYWLGLSLFMLGMFYLSLGSLVDMLSHDELVGFDVRPIIAVMTTGLSEEELDMLGVALLFGSFSVSFKNENKNLFLINKIGTLFLLFFSVLVASGNSFIHWQYEPSTKLYFVSLFLSIFGLVGIHYINERVLNSDDCIAIINKNNFYIFLLTFFVILPSTFGNARTSTVVLLWLPGMFLLAFYLLKHHPARGRPSG